MKFLYMDWHSYCRKDVLAAFASLGHSATLYPLSDTARMMGNDAATVQNIQTALTSSRYDFAFSMNYFPMVSNACERVGIPYISWIYDNPYQKAYGVDIVNECNYIFTFDSAMYEELTSKGVTTVHYAPMAANPDRLLTNGKTVSACDISFIGALYDEDHNFYDAFKQNAIAAGREYDLGYIDALIRMQLNLYGTDILTDSVPSETANAEFAPINPWNELTSYFTSPEAIFADNVLCRKVTAIERRELLCRLSQNHSVALYTKDKTSSVGSCTNFGYVDYYNDSPAVFRSSKINLNISLRSIKNGIPLRAMEIMGAGGFLLSNYQSDFLLHFEPDRDFVYYESMDDAVEKADFYLRHDSERRRIAANGLQKIREGHTYEIRLREMLALAVGV